MNLRFGLIKNNIISLRYKTWDDANENRPDYICYNSVVG